MRKANMATGACATLIRNEMMANVTTRSPQIDLVEVEQRILDFLVDGEDKLRRDLVGQLGIERERLISAMLETYWLRRAVESGEMFSEVRQ